MSGHSKWATTKRRKEAVDAKRGNLFTKLSKNISIAARDGADPAMNFKLRMAIDKAKSFSMPKDNIDRAIEKGSGGAAGIQLESVVYEGYGPGGIGLIIEGITDNKNRTVAEVKHILSKHGGSLGASNSVMWHFELKGVIHLEGVQLSDEQELQLIDWGADDIQHEDNHSTIMTIPENLQNLKQKIQENSIGTIEDAVVEYIAKEPIKPDHQENVEKLIEALEEHDDVNMVYTNAELA